MRLYWPKMCSIALPIEHNCCLLTNLLRHSFFIFINFDNETYFFFQNIIETEVPNLPLGQQHDAAVFIETVLTDNHPDDAGYETVIEYHLQCLSCQTVI